MDDVDIIHGDTGIVPFGMGSYGSRSASVGGTAIVMSINKIKEKGKKIAAHLLEASPQDIEYANGQFQVKGSPQKAVPFGQVALTAYKQRTTPRLDGRVIKLSADALVDADRRVTYYAAEIRIDSSELAKLQEVELYPGMPAEVMIVNGERTFLQYLLQPVTDSFRRAFREQ